MPISLSIAWRCGSESTQRIGQKVNRKAVGRLLHNDAWRAAIHNESGYAIALMQWRVRDLPVICRPSSSYLKENLTMLRLALVFLVIALVAAFLGYGNVANFSWEGARMLFFLFLVLAVLSYLRGRYRGGSFWG